MTALLTHRAAEPLRKRKEEPFVDIHRSGRVAIAACVALSIALSGAATGGASVGAPAPRIGPEQAAPACPDTVIPNVSVMPGAVGCWNAIAVQTVRLATPYQPQGLLYMGYVQAAVYDAVTKIEGRYVPYDDFDRAGRRPCRGRVARRRDGRRGLHDADVGVPRPCRPPPRSGCPRSTPTTSTRSADSERPASLPASAIGQAAASDLIADRAGDRDESITFTPGPLTPGGWTFAPPPSLQSAQTPWIAVMTPFMLKSPSQFRAEPPPALSSAQMGQGVQRDQGLRRGRQPVRSPEQTAIAQFWNANAVNQSNQAFQDVADRARDGLRRRRARARDGRSR